MRFFRRPAAAPIGAVRWVVIDCETSGLDSSRDRLLSVAGVALRGGRIDPSDSYGAFVGQAQASSPDNILVHGIGGDAQLAGRPLEDVMASFDAWSGEGILVAFNAPFDAAFLKRRIGLDLARLAPALGADRARVRRTLDDWLQEYGIKVLERHDALADAFATAQLFLVLLAQAARQGVTTDADLMRLARHSHWFAWRKMSR